MQCSLRIHSADLARGTLTLNAECLYEGPASSNDKMDWTILFKPTFALMRMKNMRTTICSIDNIELKAKINMHGRCLHSTLSPYLLYNIILKRFMTCRMTLSLTHDLLIVLYIIQLAHLIQEVTLAKRSDHYPAPRMREQGVTVDCSCV